MMPILYNLALDSFRCNLSDIILNLTGVGLDPVILILQGILEDSSAKRLRESKQLKYIT